MIIMAFGNITIEIELRPCLVGIEEKKSLFHKWINEEAGTTKGLIEDEYGQVQIVEPNQIQFLDHKIKDYIFDKELINYVNKGL